MVSSAVAQAILNQPQADVLGQFRQGQEYSRGQKVRELAGMAAQGDSDSLNELQGLDPMVADQLMQSIGARDRNALSGFIQDARIAKGLMDSGANEDAKQFIGNRLSALSKMGVSDTRITKQAYDKAQSGDWNGLYSMLSGFTGALDQAKEPVRGIAVEGSVINPVTGEVIYQGQPKTEEDKEGAEIRKELRKTVRDDTKALVAQANVIKSNLSKVESLAKEVKKGNRSAVAQLGVSLVKLGDPGSVVKEEELRQAFAAQDPTAALAQMASEGKVSGEIVSSVLRKLDPLNPESINIEDILSTAGALVGSSVPILQESYSLARRQAEEGGLGESFMKPVFLGADLIDSLSNLSRGAPVKTAQPPSVDDLLKKYTGK